MPASLYPSSNPASLSLGNLDLIMMDSSSTNSTSNGFDSVQNSAEQIALQLALLQQQGSSHSHHHGHGGGHHGHHHENNHHGNLNAINGMSGSSSHVATAADLLNGHGASGSLEDLKSTQRRSQNMTECVPVPSSEHVAEIVGRQGCKIKALRAKTNTYIKTPVRGEEPVFVVTGRKEDVALAKREILSAADHFSQIRASRKSNINSTLAFGQLMANTPGQTTVQVRVPYRVVGLVVGPKGATIKRIQQQTHTYIVTPSRDEGPVFEVTGLPENVEAARKEIEAHIAIRTGTTDFSGGPGANGANGTSAWGFNMNENSNGATNGDNDLFSTSGGLNSPFSSSSGNLDHVSSILSSSDNATSTTNGFGFRSNAGGGGGHGITLANLLSSESAWSNGTDSHDSGIGHSPPFDHHQNGQSNGGHSGFSAFKSFGMNPSSNSHHRDHDPTSLNGIWGELNKVLGGLDLNNQHEANDNKFLSIGSRSSLDLGTLGRPHCSSSSASESSSASGVNIQNTANNSMMMGRQLSLPSDGNNSSTTNSSAISSTTTPSTTTTLPGFNGILSSNSNQEFNNTTVQETKDDANDQGATAANNSVATPN